MIFNLHVFFKNACDAFHIKEFFANIVKILFYNNTKNIDKFIFFSKKSTISCTVHINMLILQSQKPKRSLG